MTERINGVPVEDGLYSTVDEDDYHRDRGSLSQSGAKILLQPGGPAKFREYMDNPPKPKAEYTFGHAAHALVLGKGAQIIEVDAPNWKTKAAQEIRNQATNGVAPMLTHELAIARQMANAVKAHPIAGPLFERGHAEVSLYHTDPVTGVRMRARADWITHTDIGHGERPIIVDYKTAVDANPKGWVRKAPDYGYDVQFSWYTTTYHAVMRGSMFPAMFFVVQEKVRPFLVSVIELDAEAFSLGCDKMRRALEMYRDCMESGIWPGYAERIHSMSLPPWAFSGSEPTLNDVLTEEIA